ncbi:alpha/beta fold hydrolase [Hahella ganghwensis]|uniref:alpha/beta fold hydrolase n=1 Tax=Hahella ganghwensis TaxID=286420 RepID=UPI00036D0E80|nr:alpha/beta hydrolase [Hahella ganghwensis]
MPEPGAFLHPEECLTPWEYAVNPEVTLRGWRSKPTGKPVIHFMHGNGYSGLTYWPLLSRLATHFDLFLHDVLGHGDSDPGSMNWGWNKNADLAHQVWNQFLPEYRALGQEKLIGAGHSMGGVNTILWAGRHPEVFSRLILLDPIIFTSKILLSVRLSEVLRIRRSNPLAEKTFRRRNEWADEQEAIAYFTGRGMFKGWQPEAIQAYVQYALAEDQLGSLRLKCPPQREAENFNLLPKKIWAAIRRILVPTRILYGKNTYPFVVDSLNKAARLNAHFSVTSHPGGHCFMQEYPDSTYDWILQAVQDSA